MNVITINNTNITFGEKDNQIFCTSFDIAKVFRKKHFIVLRDIENILNDLQQIGDSLGKYNFVFTYKETKIRGFDKVKGKTRKDPYYNLTRDGFALLAMGFTGKRALQWKIEFLNAFNKMENLLRTQIHTPNKYLTEIINELLPRLPKNDYVIDIALSRTNTQIPKRIFNLSYYVDNRTPRDPNSIRKEK